ncbi:MAG: DUF4013 domain-containing protein [Candidatus Nanohaloarchaea archaeon]
MIGVKNIRQALKFPFEQGDWLEKAVIGSILALGSLLIIPAPLLLGYLMRVMREESMPGFDNLLDMYIEGLKALLVATLYMIPGFALMFAFEGPLVILGLVVFLVLYYALESGFYHLANNGLRQAFSVQVLRDAFTLNYFIGLIVVGIVSFALLMAWSFSLLVIVPILLFPTVLFYQNVFRYRIMKEAIEAE